MKEGQLQKQSFSQNKPRFSFDGQVLDVQKDILCNLSSEIKEFNCKTCIQVSRQLDRLILFMNGGPTDRQND